jgi:hypothetical protein
MKRAKIMLLTIAVIATVGTALAFKVNKFGSNTYCYAETTVQPDKCEEKTITDAHPIAGVGFFYTVKGIGVTRCTSLACPNQAGSWAE